MNFEGLSIWNHFC